MACKKVAIMDIGSSAIRTLVLKSKKHKQFSVIANSQVDYAGYMEGEFLEQDALQQKIMQSLTNSQKQSKWFYKQLNVALGGEFLLVKQIEVSKNFSLRRKIKQTDIDELMESENPLKQSSSHVLIGCNAVSYTLDDEYFTTNPVGHKAYTLNAKLSYIYANKNIIELLNQIFKQTGLYMVNYIATPYAQFKTLLSEDVRKDNTVIVDVGYISSHVLIGRYNGLSSLSWFNIGGGHIMGDLAEIVKVDYGQAEHLKKNAVLNLSNHSLGGYEVFLKGEFYEVPAKIVSDIVKQRIEQIAENIKAAISSAEINYPEYLPLFLTGGGISMIKGAKEYLQNCLNRPVEVLDASHISLSGPNFAPLFAISSYCLEKEWEFSRGFLAKLLRK